MTSIGSTTATDRAPSATPTTSCPRRVQGRIWLDSTDLVVRSEAYAQGLGLGELRELEEVCKVGSVAVFREASPGPADRRRGAGRLARPPAGAARSTSPSLPPPPPSAPQRSFKRASSSLNSRASLCASMNSSAAPETRRPSQLSETASGPYVSRRWCL
jgi:hypothetical protein